MHRRALLATIPALARPAPAQSWPSRPVRMIVPFGAGAVIGTEAARSATDRHTLLMMSNTHTANETLLPNRPYALLRDFVPLAPVDIANHALIARPDLAVAPVAELTAMAKARPGALNCASSGPGTPYHIAGAKFCHMAQIQVEHIAFRSSGEARSAIMGSTVDWMFASITTQIQNIQTGRVKGLATSGERRSPRCPDCRPCPKQGSPATPPRSGSASWRRPARPMRWCSS